MLADWPIVLSLCLCQHVLTGHYSDINISISIRRMQGFETDILKLLMLMPWPHYYILSFFYAIHVQYAYACVASELRTRLIMIGSECLWIQK